VNKTHRNEEFEGAEVGGYVLRVPLGLNRLVMSLLPRQPVLKRPFQGYNEGAYSSGGGGGGVDQSDFGDAPVVRVQN
jgi:hypothetical protein